MFGIPYLCDVFDLWPELFRVFLPRWMQKFDRQIFWPLYLSRRLTWRRASGIVALCDSYLDVVHAESSGLSLDEGLVIYNGTDVARLRELLPNRSPRETSPFEEGTLNAVFAGTLGDNYDVRTILRAASAFQLLPSGRRLRFVVAGDGPLRRLVEEAAARGELDYLGVLGPKALAEAHSRSDVGLVSYQKDSNVGIPDKFYDYLAAGLPVVNSLRGDVASLVAGWDIGAAYIAGDPASLVRAIDHVVKDQPSYAASAARAWDKATMFEQKGQYDRYAEFVERIAENAGADRPPVSG